MLKKPSITKNLKVSLSGVRGLVGESLGPGLVAGLAGALGTLIDGRPVVMANDARPSGIMLCAAVKAALIGTGCRLIDIGTCPTATLGLAVRKARAGAGIMLTAGHLPEGWNGLQFIDNEGLLFSTRRAAELLDVYQGGGLRRVPWDGLGKVVERSGDLDDHCKLITRAVRAKTIRAARLKVVVDAACGAAGALAGAVLKKLACSSFLVNGVPGGKTAKNPEPRPGNMGSLARAVKKHRAAVGFAMDTNGGRLALVDERGRQLSEEYTLQLLADHLLAGKQGTVVTNVSTSMAIEEIAARHQAQVLRVPVGQPFITEASLNQDAVLGGEGSGGVVIPTVSYSYDAVAAMAFLLEALAVKGGKLSCLVAGLPRYHLLKQVIPCPPARMHVIVNRYRRHLPAYFRGEDYRLDYSDGVRLVFPDAWLHLRASATASLIRVYAEAKKKSRAAELIGKVSERIEKWLKVGR